MNRSDSHCLETSVAYSPDNGTNKQHKSITVHQRRKKQLRRIKSFRYDERLIRRHGESTHPSLLSNIRIKPVMLNRDMYLIEQRQD